MGHVNNIVYFRYFESARLAYFERVGFLDEMKRSGVGPILATTQCRFRKPLTYPDRIRVGATVKNLREDHFTMLYCIRKRCVWERSPPTAKGSSLPSITTKTAGPRFQTPFAVADSRAGSGLMDRLLKTLGLHRKELRAWAMYDWANSAFRHHHHGYGASGLLRQRLGYDNSRRAENGLLGLHPNRGARHHRAHVTVSRSGSGLSRGQEKSFSPRSPSSAPPERSSCSSRPRAIGSSHRWRSSSGTSGSPPETSSTESLLPHVAKPDEIDRVSTAGYAVGYVGGGLLLAVHFRVDQLAGQFWLHRRSRSIPVCVWERRHLVDLVHDTFPERRFRTATKARKRRA